MNIANKQFGNLEKANCNFWEKNDFSVAVVNIVKCKTFDRHKEHARTHHMHPHTHIRCVFCFVLLYFILFYFIRSVSINITRLLQKQNKVFRFSR